MMSDRKLGLSRRSFLKGTAFTVAGGALAGSGLVGCAPQTTAAPDESLASTSNIDEATTIRQAPSKLNPQNTDFPQGDSDLATLFSSVKIGPLELSNRMVKSAAGSDTQNNEEEILSY